MSRPRPEEERPQWPRRLARWIQDRMRRPRLRPPDGWIRQGLAADLIDHLVSRTESPPDGLLRAVEAFKELDPEVQDERLPRFYLLFEQYLVELDAEQDHSRDRLRTFVQQRFPALLKLDSFSLIFEPVGRQELLLSRFMVRTLLRRSYDVMGASGQHTLTQALDWVEAVPGAGLPVPFEAADAVPDAMSGWTNLLGEISLNLAAWLEDRLGAGATDRLFEASYEEVDRLYRALDTFPVVVTLLPDRLLDENKIHLLSQSQIRQTLLRHIEHLQQAHALVQQRNRELQATQTALIEAREAVEATHNQLTATLHSVGEGIVIADVKGRILDANPEAQRIWGYTHEELEGTDLRRLMPEAYRERHRQGMQRYLETGVIHVLGRRLEVEGLRRDGSTFPLEIQITEVRDVRPRRFVAAVRDITERKARENQPYTTVEASESES